MLFIGNNTKQQTGGYENPTKLNKTQSNGGWVSAPQKLTKKQRERGLESGEFASN